MPVLLTWLEEHAVTGTYDLDAASAAFRVGYHDAAHFNRECMSLFGVPPMRDVQRLRNEAARESVG